VWHLASDLLFPLTFASRVNCRAEYHAPPMASIV
jgi:hypothetical protein